jgi:membrane protein YqaA with SNARE-associated domain
VEQLASLGGMALSAFLAATILPFPSEATYAALLHLGQVKPAALFIVATVFNTLGSAVNWWIGRLIAAGGLQRLPARFRPEPESLTRAEALFARYGWPSLLLSWVPVVGDLATLAAGLLREPLWRFLVLVGLAKGLRYAAIWAGWAAIAA